MAFDSDRTAVEKRAERIGFLARSSGTPREQNPHVHPTSMPYLDLRSNEAQRSLADAWGRGWDRANAELSA